MWCSAAAQALDGDGTGFNVVGRDGGLVFWSLSATDKRMSGCNKSMIKPSRVVVGRI